MKPGVSQSPVQSNTEVNIIFVQGRSRTPRLPCQRDRLQVHFLGGSSVGRAPSARGRSGSVARAALAHLAEFVGATCDGADGGALHGLLGRGLHPPV